MFSGIRSSPSWPRFSGVPAARPPSVGARRRSLHTGSWNCVRTGLTTGTCAAAAAKAATIVLCGGTAPREVELALPPGSSVVPRAARKGSGVVFGHKASPV
ncbi:MAG: cobalt-precorrin-5B (C(1))-methyltransferase, partial [Methanoregulaceae archaeon]|nr:cobalt-precorrin-5B (C(1))-methyltransferase [Methanoregulaceae archaeon]